jgi:hypothetical protein
MTTATEIDDETTEISVTLNTEAARRAERSDGRIAVKRANAPTLRRATTRRTTS